MPRRKLSEYRIKTILCEALGTEYQGAELDTSYSTSLLPAKLRDYEGAFVVKVDQGIKGRFKKGLVLLDVSKKKLNLSIEQLKKKGYKQLLIEPQLKHQKQQEHYLAIQNGREGRVLSFSKKGGVDVEANHSVDLMSIITERSVDSIARKCNLRPEDLRKILKTMEKAHISFLEINPYVVIGEQMNILDAAAEIDDAGTFFTKLWSPNDFREHRRRITSAEKIVNEIAQNSPASFKLEVINPNGKIFLLLSGGGASVVVADEVYNKGHGQELANYGEYSGNPSAEETQLYTEQLLELLLASNSPKKTLFIGGAIANFTDIAATFSGIIQAIEKYGNSLTQQKVKVFVRRGGPNQEIGLPKIKEVLEKYNILGSVDSADQPLADSVHKTLEGNA